MGRPPAAAPPRVETKAHAARPYNARPAHSHGSGGAHPRPHDAAVAQLKPAGRAPAAAPAAAGQGAGGFRPDTIQLTVGKGGKARGGKKVTGRQQVHRNKRKRELGTARKTVKASAKRAVKVGGGKKGAVKRNLIRKPPGVPIDYSSLGAFLQSVAKKYGISQGHIGCGMKPRDRTLYISSSAANVKAQTVTEIKELVAGLDASPSFPVPLRVYVCPAYIKGSPTSNHAECRIMHAWGEGRLSNATIRTTGPACGDCAYLMDSEGVNYGLTSGIRSKTGWVHPFTHKVYGPQMGQDAQRFYRPNGKGGKYKKA